MADVIAELLVSEAAIEKLGARGISVDEAQQIPRNANVTVRNPHEPGDSKRRLLIGRTDGGRPLTIRHRSNDRSDHLADRHRLGGGGC